MSKVGGVRVEWGKRGGQEWEMIKCREWSLTQCVEGMG